MIGGTIIRFEDPFFLLLLLLIPLLNMLERRLRQRPAFLYSAASLLRGIIDIPSPPGRHALRLMRNIALALLVFGMARPQMGQGPVLWDRVGPTSIIAIDISEAMGKASITYGDELVSPIWAVRRAVGRILEGEGGGKLGLVGFADHVRLFCPPTADVDYVVRILERIEPMWGENGRVVGDAIATSIGLIDRVDMGQVEDQARQVVVICSGIPSEGAISTETALQAAKVLGIKTFVIVFSNDAQSCRTVEQVLKPLLQIDDGRVVSTSSLVGLENTLGELLVGQGFFARRHHVRYQRYAELYSVFVVPALSLLLMEAILGNTVWRRLP